MAKTIAKTIDYKFSIGLNIWVNSKLTLAQVCFSIKDDNTVVAHIESARNGSKINKTGSITLTADAFQDAPEDAYDNIIFARWAFRQFGITI